MSKFDYSTLSDDHLLQLLFMAEDRLEKDAALTIARRDSLAPHLAAIVREKQAWLAELPEWWSVVHATYLLALRAGEDEVLPLITAMHMADAFDNDWITEVIPSLFANLGPAALPRLTAIVRDSVMGWSIRDLCMRAMAAITLKSPEAAEHVFRIIGERFMDEGEERIVRQLAGRVLLDFRRNDYRLALLQFVREDWAYCDLDPCYYCNLDQDTVEMAFKDNTPELWHYEEDWMRFYEPVEIQKRQKRWLKERISSARASRFRLPSTGGRVLQLQPRGGDSNPLGD